ncbi:hypothetical protein WA026_021013 [Henosepilachna vigintioctopunctata]|uniref:Reverse transcriptase domain-containing protein n=1 Tax=Henosepilachna vigintioctopunctata TaxID=420089 RepID=A0AAW1VF77_9CUCU
MGSPLSPILAMIVMDHLLDNVIPLLPFQLPFIYKYVDDLICAVPQSQVASVLETFNSFNNNLRFTVEVENNRGVPFLDTLVIRSDNNIITLDWYQKPTSSGRFLNFHSNHPTTQKFNMVVAMRNRVLRICDERFHRGSLRKLFLIFRNNGYPGHILQKLIYNSRFYDGPIEDTTVEFNYKKIPFIHGLTNSVVSIFSKYSNIKLAKYSPVKIVNLFSRIKEETPIHLNSSVVYKIPCTDCSGVYIGQTKQWLKNRITQHRSDIRIKKLSCAATKHCVETGHNFEWCNVKILERELNYRCRLFLEMYHHEV